MPDLTRPHIYRTGKHGKHFASGSDLDPPNALRKQIEPWLTAVFQSKHL